MTVVRLEGMPRSQTFALSKGCVNDKQWNDREYGLKTVQCTVSKIEAVEFRVSAWRKKFGLLRNSLKF